MNDIHLCVFEKDFESNESKTRLCEALFIAKTLTYKFRA